jgi:hypothetical protein
LYLFLACIFFDKNQPNKYKVKREKAKNEEKSYFLVKKLAGIGKN